ncbi:hypothetical protein [Tenggerimyces flavus]|uniref:Hydrogenase-4 component E n=1 Tax=Tenggerimyces flavus TaxID=1708749 RepID=A0ABV7YKL9_9ACTN|nr:hypothetical protein [Tenggerimyces flavus]MBM7789642.1 hydrogenase-4 component E [Tenggerimyces flavus]
MSETVFVALLNVTSGLFLLAAVLVLWRRDLFTIIRLFSGQGVALGLVVGVVAWHDASLELALLAVGIAGLRGVLLPFVVRRAVGDRSQARESKPLVNVASSLLAGAALTLLAYVVSEPLIALAPSPATRAIPIALTVVLLGFLVLVSRRRPVSQIVGFLLIDNGITATAFLTTSGVPLVVELAVSLDVLFVALVLRLLTGRIQSAFGDADLDELKELRDT